MPRQSLPQLSAITARRLLLDAQGLLADPQRPANAAELFKLIREMGFVQIDTISVVERAHHLILHSRLERYRPAMFAELLEQSRDLFEHWTHDASAIPTEWFPHWRHRFERYRHRIRTNAWWKQRIGERPNRILKAVKDRIAREGPVLSRDFEHDRSAHPPAEKGWWGWKPQKAALEHLWRVGELAVARRVNFQKVYDLTERVLPAQHALPMPNVQEHVAWACRSALERLGVATPTEIAAFWHAIDHTQARQWCNAAAKRGEIAEVMVESLAKGEPRQAFATLDWEARMNRLKLSAFDDRIRLLAPFDPVIRDRKRTQRLFGFDYTFEAFVPAAKRRFGYYVMPILEGDRLIGRLNPKTNRSRGVLEINGLWWEPKIKPTKSRMRQLSEAVERLAGFVGVKQVDWAAKS